MARTNDDVFLSLAQDDNSDEHEYDQFEDAREEHEDSGNRIYGLPGQFPSPRHSPRVGNSFTRPQSSGQPLSTQLGDTLSAINGSSVRHIRHASQPDPAKHLSLNTRLAERGSTSSRLRIASPAFGSLLSGGRTNSVDMSQADGGSELPGARKRRSTYLAGPSGNIRAERTTTDQNYGHARAKPQIPDRRGISRTPSTDSESAESRTAPSTVWDDLDDLKARLRKLETTSRIPPVPEIPAAYSTGDRPRTATTAPTTISSSPRNARKTSAVPTELTLGGPSPSSSAQNLLQSALARAKTQIQPHLYRPLETAASDAIALASISSTTGPQGTGYSGASVVSNLPGSDRQLRRKADSLCRNLTDLCIALCDAKSQEVHTQSSPSSARKRFQQRASSPVLYARETREVDDEDTRSVAGDGSRHRTRKSMSRLDDFRQARGITPSIEQDSSEVIEATEQSPSTNTTNMAPRDYSAKYAGITSTASTRKRNSLIAETSDSDSIARAPSRAMTEIGHGRQASFTFRRELLGSGAQRSPSLRETLAARRVSANLQDDASGAGAQSAGYNGQTPGSRFLSDRARVAPSETGSTISSARRRISIGNEPFTPSFRLGTPPLRTSSLSQRHMAAE